MKTYIKITLFTLTALLAACKGDDDGPLAPTNLDKDWLLVEDNNDPLDHACYEIYRDLGISVYYTDTLGKEFRSINAYGDSIINIEKLDPFYSVTATDASTTYLLSKDRDALLNGVLFFRERVLSGLPPALYPHTILLVNELTLNAFLTAERGKRFGNVYNGYRTVIISNVGRLGDMTDEEKGNLTEEIIATIYYHHARDHHAQQLEIFFGISEASWTPQALFPSAYYTMVSSGMAATYKPHWHQYGFLISSPSMPGQLSPNLSVPGEYTRYYTPTRDEDAIQFFIAAFHYTAEEFEAEYGSVTGYDLLRAKYDLIREIINTIKNTR
ncbi:MAG: hypothetical protein LBP56_04205 [Odoribacteraceae bacterium]|jgi:hypothetical protein|nr:hypothetical protein [Odoribacteraceae bacterium]